jgi:MFS family permease
MKHSTPPSDVADAAPPEYRPVYSWYVVGLLTLIYTLSFVDRQILTLLFAPIKRDLHISDTQVSLLSGIAFAGLYAVLGVPIAWLADRSHRVRLIATGMVLWSVMTAAAGVARTFLHLFVARVGVGIGEAALTPAAYSLISDYFPAAKLTRAISVYTLAIYLGTGLALLLGGVLIGTVETLPHVTVPFFGALRPWQLALILVGTPGIAVAALLLTVREPRRRSPPQAMHNSDAGIAGGGFRPFLQSRRAFYVAHMLGFSLAGLYGSALATWIPELFRRSYGWPVSHTAFLFGIILLVVGAPSVLFGGWYADRVGSHGKPDAHLRVAIVALVPMAIAGSVLPLVSDPHIALLSLAICIACFGIPGALAPAVLQLATPNRYRAQISAVYLLATTLIGQGGGPTLVAAISDYGFHDEQSLRYSLSIVAATTVPLAALCLWSAARSFRGAHLDPQTA